MENYQISTKNILFLMLLTDTWLIGTRSEPLTVTPDEVLFPLHAARRYIHTEIGSYFGYSVAGYVGQSKPFCLVGAPRAKHDPFAGLTINESTSAPTTGLVYRIDLDPELPHCSIVPIATTDELRKEVGTPTPGISSWLGGSVAAASNRMDGIQVGCDPRYIFAPETINRTSGIGYLKQTTRLGTGQCALYTGASMQYTSVDACSSQEEGACLAGFSVDIETGTRFGEALVAIGMPGSYLTEGNLFLGHYIGRELVKAMRLKTSPQDLQHKGFNLGYAVHLDRLFRDESKRGAPRHSYSLLASSPMWIDNEYRGIVMILDQALDLGGIEYLKDQWGHIGSFFGYSITTADLDGNGIADIIVSAPYYTEKHTRDQKPMEKALPLRTAKSLMVNMSKEQRNSGGEELVWGGLLPDIGRVYIFYGISRNIMDGSDGGVPFTYERPEYTSRPPLILNGPKSIGGRFGHAVENLGDVDGDGTEDLAISCPYCADPSRGQNKGAVYIYLGQKDSFIKQTPFQIIWPGELPRTDPFITCGDLDHMTKTSARPFKSFGWSLSSGIDLDRNHAPDLVVGDFDSDQVVLLRSRNTLWFDSPEWTLPLTRTLPWSGPDQTDCVTQCQFEVKLSVIMHGKPALLKQLTKPTQFNIHVVIDLDALMENLVYKRLVALNTLDLHMQTHPVIGLIDTIVPVRLTNEMVRRGNRLPILSLTLQPQSGRVRSFAWKPICINASISPVPQELPSTSWTLHPYLGERYFTSRQLHFANPVCGDDNICQADLQVRMLDKSIGPVDNLIVYFRERATERNLTVGIGNLAENAYVARLHVTIPHQFGFTIPADLTCQTKISNEHKHTELLCDLGDPLSFTGTNLKPYVFQLSTAGAFRELDDPILNDQPHEQAPQSDALELTPVHGRRTKRTALISDSVTITAEVFSGNDDIDLKDNIVSVTYQLQLAAKVELSSSSIDRTTIDSRNFTVQLYEMQRVHPETLGPEFKHIYLVSNDGPSPIEQLWVNVSVPIQTENGEYLVYLLDRIRYQAEDGGPPVIASVAPEVISAEGHIRGTCTTPEWALNPLRLNAVHRGRPDYETTQAPTDSPKNRVARSAEFEQKTKTDGSSTESTVRSARSILPSMRRRQQELVKCDEELVGLGKPICVTIRCRINQLSHRDAVRIVIRGHVWADTYFRHKISDLAIVSQAVAELPATAFGIHVHGNLSIQPLAISQNFVFNGIKIPLFREIPLWPIILGCLLGVGLLVLIIFGMWKCGFFRRRRWYDEANSNTVSVVPTDL